MVLVGKGTWKVRNWEGEWEIKINVWKRLTFPNKNLFQGTFQWHFRENFQLLAFSLFEIVPGVPADLDPPRFGPPGPNPLADTDPPVQIR